MCPECFASVALLVTGVVSSGAVAAVAANLFRTQKPLERASEVQIPKAKEDSK